MKQAFIIGSGGWGTALGIVLSEAFDKVRLWEYDASYAAEVQKSRENRLYLSGVPLPPKLEFQSHEEGIAEASLVLFVAPSEHLRTVARRFMPRLPQGVLCVVATKGIEKGSLMTMSQLLEEEAQKAGLSKLRLVTLSGPSHAEEVGRRMPTTVVAAGDNLQDAKDCQLAFSGKAFRVYTSSDHLGVELGGSLKNVIALASGIADGLGLGDNSKAAIMTRGLAEMTRLGVSMGAKASTFAGLTGMGDLVVTCMSRHSRNRSVGERLGRGERWEQIKASMRMVAEGVPTCDSAHALAKRQGIEMPLCEAVYQILFESKAAGQALEELMSRDLKGEEA